MFLNFYCLPQVALQNKNVLNLDSSLKYKKIVKCWKFYEYKKIAYYKSFFEFFYCLRQVAPGDSISLY